MGSKMKSNFIAWDGLRLIVRMINEMKEKVEQLGYTVYSFEKFKKRQAMEESTDLANFANIFQIIQKDCGKTPEELQIGMLTKEVHNGTLYHGFNAYM